MNLDQARQVAVAAVHQSGGQCVLALTGGGSLAAAQLLSVPGASRTILEVIVPYHATALEEFLGHVPAQCCSADTSRMMAERALDRARWLSPGHATLGLGCTASLASDRPKRGDHRVFVSTADGAIVRTWSVFLSKEARDRAEEEQVAAAVVLHALTRTLGLTSDLPLALLPGEQIEEPAEVTESWRPLLADREFLFFAEDGQLQRDIRWRLDRPMVLVPGSFNPLHGGHWRLAEAAAVLTGRPVAFEVSVANVDKPDLSFEEVRRRLAQFSGLAGVWVTRCPRFLDKARLFPGAIFAVGADTAARLLDPRYYDKDEGRMLEALGILRELGCRFLVAGRADLGGAFLGLEDLAIPASQRDLFSAIPPDVFRMDISSTLVRGRLNSASGQAS